MAALSNKQKKYEIYHLDIPRTRKLVHVARDKSDRKLKSEIASLAVHAHQLLGNPTPSGNVNLATEQGQPISLPVKKSLAAQALLKAGLYKKVATVMANSGLDAYKLTMSVNERWYLSKNKHIELADPAKTFRSTTTWDIIVEFDADKQTQHLVFPLALFNVDRRVWVV